MDQTAAESYAKSWIEAWNAHDAEKLAEHYADNVVFRSPFVVKVPGYDDPVIKGREAVRKYLQAGMEAFPHVRFQLHRVGVGIDSIVLNYISVDGALANEVHVMDDEGKAIDVRCHYSAAL